MKIYTKSGDEGTTGLFGGPRVSKDDARIEAYGTVDELNAAIGVARATSLPEDIDPLLAGIQADLFTVGAELATPDPQAAGMPCVGEEQVLSLERAIDTFEDRLPALTSFILPAGSPSTAGLHLARAICRRAERRVVTLSREAQISPAVVIYLNRLGDLLFVLSRIATQVAGLADTPWVSPRSQ